MSSSLPVAGVTSHGIWNPIQKVFTCNYMLTHALNFHLGVLRCWTLCWGLCSTWRWVLYKVRDRNSFFCMLIAIFPVIVCKDVLCFFIHFGIFAQNQAVIVVWSYVWVLYYIPLICVSILAEYHAGFITLAM